MVPGGFFHCQAKNLTQQGCETLGNGMLLSGQIEILNPSRECYCATFDKCPHFLFAICINRWEQQEWAHAPIWTR